MARKTYIFANGSKKASINCCFNSSFIGQHALYGKKLDKFMNLKFRFKVVVPIIPRFLREIHAYEVEYVGKINENNNK